MNRQLQRISNTLRESTILRRSALGLGLFTVNDVARNPATEERHTARIG